MKRLALGAAALVVLLLLAVAALNRPPGVAAGTAAAGRVDLVVPILSDGTLEPPEGGELRAPDRAIVAGIHAREGERVRRGTVLVDLENASLSTRSRDARAAVAELEAEYAKAAADLKAEEAEAERAKTVFEGDGRLLAEGAITRATHDADELALARARQRVEAARARRATHTGARRELARE
jgi:multidrug efflux pump subunit AcrA (membrane-fusion protein)